MKSKAHKLSGVNYTINRPLKEIKIPVTEKNKEKLAKKIIDDLNNF